MRGALAAGLSAGRATRQTIAGWALWGTIAVALAYAAGRIAPHLPTSVWMSGAVLTGSAVGVAFFPEISLAGMLIVKQVAPQNALILVLATSLALVALLAGAWRRLPPVAGIAFGLFLLVALPSVHLHDASWDRVPPFYAPKTDWQVFPIPSYDVLAALGLTATASIAVLAAYVVRTREHLDRMFLALAIGSMYPILRGIKDRVTGNLQYHDGAPSVQSVFTHPNDFAVYLVAVVPLLAAAAVHARSKEQRIFSGGLAALGALDLILTFSRSGWVALLAAVIVGAVLAGKIRQVAIVAAVVVVLGGALGVAGPVVDRFSGLSTTPSASSLQAGNSWSWRIVTWSRMLEVTPDWQLTGVGYARYETHTVEVFGLGGQINTTLATGWRRGFGAHNDFVEQYVETGLPGLVLWSTFMLGLLGIGVRLWRRWRDPYAIAGFVSALSLIIMSISDNVQAYNTSWFVVAGALTAVRCYYLEVEADANVQTPKEQSMVPVA